MIVDSIKVKMAEYALGKSPDLLVTIGLGSCIGIAIYDPKKGIGGLIHIMLPENRKGLRPAKYADTGIPLLIQKMEDLGANKRNLVAKIAGGAHMFASTVSLNMMVGERNIEAVHRILAKERIKIIGEDVGGDYGRTMEFYTKDGSVLIRSYKKGKNFI